MAVEKTREKDTQNLLVLFFFILMAGFILRIILAGLNVGHESDMACFTGWAERITQTGFAGFYSDGVFTDYPPGYMYVLYILGKLKQIFSLEDYSFWHLVLMKLPAVLCDMGTAFLFFKLGKKKNILFGLLAGILFLFNPVIILDSAVWGQVDSIFTLCVVLACYFVTEKKLPASYFVFALGILIKPQTLVFTPVLLFGVWKEVCQGGFHVKQFSRQALWALLSILSLFAAMMPFGLEKVITQYITTLGSYPYASVNAYNIWALFGLNWAPQTNTFLGVTYNKWGTLSIIAVVVLAAYLWYKKSGRQEVYFLCGAVIMGGMFLFSVRMHERYLYPIAALLLGAYLISQNKKWLYSYLIFSAGHFLNVYRILYYGNSIDTSQYDLWAGIIALILLIGYGCLIYWVFHLQEGKEYKKRKDVPGLFPLLSDNGDPFTLDKKDFIVMGAITLLYAIVAFYDLGYTKGPETFWTASQEGETAVLDFGQPVYISRMDYFQGNYENRNFTLMVSEYPEGPYEYVTDISMERVFAWGEVTVNEKGRYWRIVSKDSKSSIGELIFYDYDGSLVTPVESADGGEALFDEQDTYDGRRSFRNGTYFDEIYHARTAYEYIKGLYSYENTHPPLGKILIALGIKIWGLNPFGWRFMGTLFGVFMVPFLYLFSRRILNSRFFSTITTILFAADFMHFTQTRIATIDVFVTFFIILMYYFMYAYFTSEKKRYLCLSGIAMGFGAACKWTGIYAGAGLGILFFGHLILKYLKDKDKEKYWNNTWKTIGLCLVFFVAVPAAIYTLSYIPFRDGSDRGLIARMIYNQQTMFSYHTGIDATHPYSSWWYQWPFIYRPIWYYSGQISETVKEGISAFGNPLVWWCGIPAFFHCGYLAVRRKDRKAGFLAFGYLAQYVPWFFVSRITFIYHYFTSVPFVVLMLGYSLFKLYELSSGTEKPHVKRAFIVYTVLTVCLFVLFYPVLSGHGVSVSYVQDFLRWFDSWVLI